VRHGKWLASHLPRPMAGVSVIIASNNRPTLMQEALSSVLDQSDLPVETIIVDDADAPLVSRPASCNGITLRLLRHAQAGGPPQQYGAEIGGEGMRRKVECVTIFIV
jgi:hypothetical protein